MPKVNAAKIYIAPKTEPVHLGQELMLKELHHLIEAVQERIDESQREAFEKDINRHIGPNSTYRLRRQARRGLKVIYDRFMAPDTKDSEKTMIALKLQERSEECTPGFHNGINEIMDGFFLAKNLDDLMYRVRQDIVARAATQISDDDHVNNRCFYVAEQAGYGVRPIHRDDPYLYYKSEIIPNAMIRSALQSAFARELRVFRVLQALEDQFYGQLSRAGYEGLKAEGYPPDEIEAIESQLMHLFKDTPEVQELLQAEEALKAQEELGNARKQAAREKMKAFAEARPEVFTEFDKFNTLKIKALFNEGGLPPFVKTWASEAMTQLAGEAQEAFLAIKSDYEAADLEVHTAKERARAAHWFFRQHFFLQSDQGTTNLNWPHVRQLLWEGVKAEGYFEFTDDEALHINTVMDPYASKEGVVASINALFQPNQYNLDETLQVLEYLSVPDDLLVEILATHLQDGSVEAVLKILRASIKPELKHELLEEKASDELKLHLYQSVRNKVWYNFMDHKSIDSQLIIIQALPEGMQVLIKKEVLTGRSDEYSLFELWFWKVPPEKKLFIPLGMAQAIAMYWIQPHLLAMNNFMLACLLSSKSAGKLLNIMAELPEADRVEVLEEALTQQESWSGRNALMLALDARATGVFTQTLELLKTLPEADRARVMAKVLMQRDKQGRNLFMRVTESAPSLFTAFFLFVWGFDQSQLIGMLQRFLGRPSFPVISEYAKERTLEMLSNLELLESTDKLKLLLDVKERLSDFSEVSQEIFDAVRRCLQTMEIKDQQAFYEALPSSQPKLKQSAFDEMSFKTKLQAYHARIPLVADKAMVLTLAQEAMVDIGRELQRCAFTKPPEELADREEIINLASEILEMVRELHIHSEYKEKLLSFGEAIIEELPQKAAERVSHGHIQAKQRAEKIEQRQIAAAGGPVDEEEKLRDIHAIADDPLYSKEDVLNRYQAMIEDIVQTEHLTEDIQYQAITALIQDEIKFVQANPGENRQTAWGWVWGTMRDTVVGIDSTPFLAQMQVLVPREFSLESQLKIYQDVIDLIFNDTRLSERNRASLVIDLLKQAQDLFLLEDIKTTEALDAITDMGHLILNSGLIQKNTSLLRKFVGVKNQYAKSLMSVYPSLIASAAEATEYDVMARLIRHAIDNLAIGEPEYASYHKALIQFLLHSEIIPDNLPLRHKVRLYREVIDELVGKSHLELVDKADLAIQLLKHVERMVGQQRTRSDISGQLDAIEEQVGYHAELAGVPRREDFQKIKAAFHPEGQGKDMKNPRFGA